MSARNELQEAIYDKLDADLSVSVIAAGNVPDSTVDQYVVIGLGPDIPWDTDGLLGFEFTVTIHTWDTTAGNRSFVPLNNIMGEISDSLNRAELTVMGYNVIGVDYEFGEPFVDPDGLTRHGVQRFRVYLRTAP